MQVTTEAEREAFQASLSDAEDWLYSDGEGEAAPAFRCILRKDIYNSLFLLLSLMAEVNTLLQKSFISASLDMTQE